jgi:hypothetical protein
MTPIKCNHPETLALTAREAGWARKRLAYWQTIAYPGVDPARIARLYGQAVAQITAVCGIEIDAASSPGEAQILASAGPIDGPWNVLALTELPPVPDFDGGVLHQTFDVSEQLDDPTMLAMFCHEACHFLGLGHDVAGTLMSPYLDPRITTPQARDIAQLQDRYGPPAQLAPDRAQFIIGLAELGELLVEVTATVPCTLGLSVVGFRAAPAQ